MTASVPVKLQLPLASFTPLPQPILPDPSGVYVQKQLQQILVAQQVLLGQAPQAATKAPQNPVDGMIRLARAPWRPASGQTADAWVYFDGAANTWVLAGLTTPTNT